MKGGVLLIVVIAFAVLSLGIFYSENTSHNIKESNNYAFFKYSKFSNDKNFNVAYGKDLGEVLLSSTNTCNSITQYGVTWTFSTNVTCGQFVGGDWWVTE